MAITCYRCQATFTKKQGLWRHVKLVHGPPLYFCCGHCSYRDKRRDNLRRHYKGCHPDSMGEFSQTQKVAVEERRGGVTMPVSVDRRLLVGKWAPVERERSPIREGGGQPSGSGEAVISLSPTPISPLRGSSPVIRLSGKPRSFFRLMRKSPESSPTSSPESAQLSSPHAAASSGPPGDDVGGKQAALPAGEVETEETVPPVKRMRLATIEEKVFRKTFIDGKLVRDEVSHRTYRSPVDANRYTLDEQRC